MNNKFDLKVRIKQSLNALHMFQKAEHIPELITLAAYICFMDVDFAHSLEKLSKAKVKDEIKQFLAKTDPKFIDALVTEKLDEVEFSIILRVFIDAFTSYGNAEDYGKAVAQVLAEVLADEFHYEFFSSNESLANLVKALVGDQQVNRFYDGASGIGLIASKINAQDYFLRDINQLPLAMAEVLFKLAGKRVDCQLQDSLAENELSNEVDLVVCTPPFGERINPNVLKGTPYLRHLSKIMPSNASDSAWIQQALYQLNETGKAFIQVPSGWLFRGGYDLALRSELIENDWIDSIILLPKGFMRHSRIETILLVLNKGEKKHNGVQLIDISQFVKRQVLRSTISEEDLQHIASVFHGKVDEDVCKIVTVDEIRSSDMNLSFNKYFINEIQVKRLDLVQEHQKLQKLEQDFIGAQAKLHKLLEQCGLNTR